METILVMMGAAVFGYLVVSAIRALAEKPAAAQRAAGPPAGWYADPSGDPRLRWWDGAAWTPHTREAAPEAKEDACP